MRPHTEVLAAWLDWYRDMGADECIGEHALDRLRPPAPADPLGELSPRTEPASTADARPEGLAPGRVRPAAPLRTTAGALQSAREIAAGCPDLEALATAVAAFEGCTLKDTALNCCFADGSPGAELMLIGEAPGAEEDRLGRPFVGPSGQLLDRMLAAIGLDRSAVYITNLIFWRPPGNRPPTSAEVAICQPFLERQIELLQPRLIVFLGGAAARALLGVQEGVTKLRGRRFTYAPATGAPIPAVITFHPAYLLRQPAHKRLAWRDLLAIRRALAEAGPVT